MEVRNKLNKSSSRFRFGRNSESFNGSFRKSVTSMSFYEKSSNASNASFDSERSDNQELFRLKESLQSKD